MGSGNDVDFGEHLRIGIAATDPASNAGGFTGESSLTIAVPEQKQDDGLSAPRLLEDPVAARIEFEHGFPLVVRNQQDQPPRFGERRLDVGYSLASGFLRNQAFDLLDQPIAKAEVRAQHDRNPSSFAVDRVEQRLDGITHSGFSR